MSTSELPRKQLRQFVADHAPQLARPITRETLAFLVQGREQCGGDLDKLLVLMAIVVRMNEHPNYPGLKPEDLKNQAIYPLPSLPVSVQSIADVTGIPRESARRKVVELVSNGWVERAEESNHLRLTPQGHVDIQPMRENLIDIITQSVISTQALTNRNG